MSSVDSKEEKATLYEWAFRAGLIMYECLEGKYGSEGAQKRLKNIILNLRSESLPDKFRRELVNSIIEVVEDRREVSFRDEIRSEHSWSVSEFQRYSTAILAGLYDALQAKMREKMEKEGKER